eukprot:1935453-Amphidinium_carterae.1
MKPHEYTAALRHSLWGGVQDINLWCSAFGQNMVVQTDNRIFRFGRAGSAGPRLVLCEQHFYVEDAPSCTKWNSMAFALRRGGNLKVLLTRAFAVQPGSWLNGMDRTCRGGAPKRVPPLARPEDPEDSDTSSSSEGTPVEPLISLFPMLIGSPAHVARCLDAAIDFLSTLGGRRLRHYFHPARETVLIARTTLPTRMQSVVYMGRLPCADQAAKIQHNLGHYIHLAWNCCLGQGLHVGRLQTSCVSATINAASEIIDNYEDPDAGDPAPVPFNYYYDEHPAVANWHNHDMRDLWACIAVQVPRLGYWTQLSRTPRAPSPFQYDVLPRLQVIELDDFGNSLGNFERETAGHHTVPPTIGPAIIFDFLIRAARHFGWNLAHFNMEYETEDELCDEAHTLAAPLDSNYTGWMMTGHRFVAFPDCSVGDCFVLSSDIKPTLRGGLRHGPHPVDSLLEARGGALSTNSF